MREGSVGDDESVEPSNAARAMKEWMLQAGDAAVIAWLAPIPAARDPDLVTGWRALCNELERVVEEEDAANR
jgi:hypothetical protein